MQLTVLGSDAAEAETATHDPPHTPRGEALSPELKEQTRAALPRAEIDSAGTGGWHVGKPPYGPAITAAARRGRHDAEPAAVGPPQHLDLEARVVRPDELAGTPAALRLTRAGDAAIGTQIPRDRLGNGCCPDWGFGRWLHRAFFHNAA